LIHPSANIISSVGVGSTLIFVDNCRPFFNPINENVSSLEFQKDIYLISQDQVASATATAVVSSAGTVSSIVITDGGFGYTEAPSVVVQSPVGIASTTTTCVSYISSGIVTSIIVTGVTTGYSQENPPLVLIEPPIIKIESTKVLSYGGDFGVITGIATTSVGVASTGIIFDFMIPINSPLRNSKITGLTTVSQIKTDYYFVVSNSNIGNGLTSLDESSNIVGIATTFLDGVYKAVDVSIEQSSIIGVGTTYIARVTVSVDNLNGLSGIGISDYYGDFSWGRVILDYRQKESAFNAYTLNGYSGISTGTILKRKNPLKYSQYKNP